MSIALADFVAELTLKAAALRRKVRELREGQALMNVLHELSPQLHADMNNSQADPFYDDSLVPVFWQMLEWRIHIRNEREVRDGGQTETV